jgi:uncharacterized membrane protein YdbT with pleckstrin-like domain
MPFPKRLLNTGEEIAADLHPHWLFFFGPVMGFGASVLLGIVVLVAGPDDGGLRTFVRWLALLALVISAVWLLVRYLRWMTTNLTITNDRIVYRYGLVAKQGMEIPIERVNNVSFRQGILERIFGNGDLTIESGGEDGQQHFSHVRTPEKVQALIHAQMDRNEQRRFQPGGAAAPPPTPPGADVADQLERLEALMERGTLTRAEFEAQKAKLLGR